MPGLRFTHWAVGLLAFAASFTSAHAQTQSVKLEAHYAASLAGLPIGKGTWTIDIGDSQYTAAASGMTTGLVRMFTGGRATGAAHGTLAKGQVTGSNYAATIHAGKKDDQVSVLVNAGNVKEFKAEPPPDDNPERVPVTDAHRKGVMDPMTSTLIRVPGNGDPRTAEACERQVSVFDGRVRYDLKLGFKRMETVQSKKGYGGQVVVCSVQFIPIAGFVPNRTTVKYVAKAKDIEVWLAPIAGTRVMVPYRAQIETPFGMGVVQATDFITTSGVAAAAVKPNGTKGAKTQ